MVNNRYRILLVEDDELTRRLAQTEMRCLPNLHVDTATNGREALLQIAQNDYALIMMDVQMPEMDGLQATKRLRDAGYVVPIVGITARDCMKECLEAGMNDCLRKPVDYLRVADYWLSGLREAS